MTMEGVENPALIYPGLPSFYRGRPRTPVVLLHDGGGTSFSYHCLDPTNRPLYGLHNAHFDEGGWWEGGIPEMAAHYIGLLDKTLPAGGDIILGGWSLGGMLSLEMAHQLALRAAAPEGESGDGRKPPAFRVRGMIWVDTTFPRRGGSGGGGEGEGEGDAGRDVTDAGPHALPTAPVRKPAAELAAMKLQAKVDLNMVHARMMARAWTPPSWAPPAGRPPSTVLLRALESFDRQGSFVDHNRNLPRLGWDAYSTAHGDFIAEVVDVEGHHFSIFRNEYIEDVTRKICNAADKFDQME